MNQDHTLPSISVNRVKTKSSKVIQNIFNLTYSEHDKPNNFLFNSPHLTSCYQTNIFKLLWLMNIMEVSPKDHNCWSIKYCLITHVTANGMIMSMSPLTAMTADQLHDILTALQMDWSMCRLNIHLAKHFAWLVSQKNKEIALFKRRLSNLSLFPIFFSFYVEEIGVNCNWGVNLFFEKSNFLIW